MLHYLASVKSESNTKEILHNTKSHMIITSEYNTSCSDWEQPTQRLHTLEGPCDGTATRYPSCIINSILVAEETYV
jgi:hypothetical protein